MASFFGLLRRLWGTRWFPFRPPRSSWIFEDVTQLGVSQQGIPKTVSILLAFGSTNPQALASPRSIRGFVKSADLVRTASGMVQFGVITQMRTCRGTAVSKVSLGSAAAFLFLVGSHCGWTKSLRWGIISIILLGFRVRVAKPCTAGSWFLP